MTSSTTDHSIRGLLRGGISRLRGGNIPSFIRVAELLLLHATGRNRTWLYAHPEELVTGEVVARFELLLERRLSGVPTQHLTGKQEFWGMEFEVTPDVLIPRPETEHLVEVTLDRLAVREVRAGRPARLMGENLSIVDVGTGSGCIAIALSKELPGAALFATDLSTAALSVAHRNASRLGYSERIQFAKCDLLSKFLDQAAQVAREPIRFDVVVSNPPYIGRKETDSLPIEVSEHEPHMALFGGEEGHELYANLVIQAGRLLKPGGLLVLELGHASLPAVRPLLETQEWKAVGVTNDLAGIPRVISAERAERLA